jgi:hypothetical protein
MMKEKTFSPPGAKKRARRQDDGLGPNTDIGSKLRALYGSVQDESIPDTLLDLLEKLEAVEQQSKNATNGE